MNQKNIIFVGGAASVGKSSLINNLKKQGTIVAMEKSEAYKELGKIKGLHDFSEIFSKISEEEYIDYLMTVLNNTDTLIIGLHYAFQPQKDTLLFMGINQEVASEQYECSITDSLIEKLKAKGIYLVTSILTAKPETLQNRAINRNKITGQPIRNFVLAETVRELEAEQQYFALTASRSQANFTLEVDGKDMNEVCAEFLLKVNTLINNKYEVILDKEVPSDLISLNLKK